MLYRISVTERGLTGIANIFRSRLSRLDDLLGAGTVPVRSFAYLFVKPSNLFVKPSKTRWKTIVAKTMLLIQN